MPFSMPGNAASSGLIVQVGGDKQAKMTEGEVCLDGAEIVRDQVATASRRSVPRSIQRKSRLRFQNRTCSATIGTEFGSHLGNVGLGFLLVVGAVGFLRLGGINLR
jgi:hypothetical protein